MDDLIILYNMKNDSKFKKLNWEYDSFYDKQTYLNFGLLTIIQHFLWKVDYYYCFVKLLYSTYITDYLGEVISRQKYKTNHIGFKVLLSIWVNQLKTPKR